MLQQKSEQLPATQLPFAAMAPTAEPPTPVTPTPAHVHPTRRNLTYDEKLQIIAKKDAEPSWTQETLALWATDTFALVSKPTQATISNILRGREKLEAMNVPPGFRSARPVKNPELDLAIVHWVVEMLESDTPVTRDAISKRAAVLAAESGMSSNLAFSKGWVSSFMKRHQLQTNRRRGNSSMIDVDPARLRQRLLHRITPTPIVVPVTADAPEAPAAPAAPDAPAALAPTAAASAPATTSMLKPATAPQSAATTTASTAAAAVAALTATVTDAVAGTTKRKRAPQTSTTQRQQQPKQQQQRQIAQSTPLLPQPSSQPTHPAPVQPSPQPQALPSPVIITPTPLPPQPKKRRSTSTNKSTTTSTTTHNNSSTSTPEKDKQQQQLHDLECQRLQVDIEAKQVHLMVEKALARKKLLDAGIPEVDVNKLFPL